MNTIVGEKIKNLRKSKNLSQEEVAELIHVSQSTYARPYGKRFEQLLGRLYHTVVRIIRHTARRTLKIG